jgi:hypothetical protein
MAYPTPKILYDAGSGTVTVTPTYPNIQKPYMDNFEAVRHDSITSDGVRQSITERVDRVRPINFETVPWTDMPMWESFFAYAIQGGPFSYYPDGTATAFQTWQLVDDKIAPTFVAFGLSKFAMNMRLVPGGASST